MVKKKYQNEKITKVYEVSKIKNKKCIKNYPVIRSINKYIPFLTNYIYNLRQTIKLGTSDIISPFFRGETSISNIVKRFPINFIFKPLIYLSVILMFLYWYNFNNFFSSYLNSKKNYFTYFGILSATFLFLHVFFLGIEYENKLFLNFKRLVIILFILFEILAQIFLSIKLFKNKSLLIKKCFLSIIWIKIIFVSIVLVLSAIIIGILIVSNLSSNVDYILEWNYFFILLVYYFLSYMMWKKLPGNPTST